MSDLEKRQRLTRRGTGRPKVHVVRYETRPTGNRYVALCGLHFTVQETREVWGDITCDVCKLRLPNAQKASA